MTPAQLSAVIDRWRLRCKNEAGSGAHHGSVEGINQAIRISLNTPGHHLATDLVWQAGVSLGRSMENPSHLSAARGLQLALDWFREEVQREVAK